MLQLDINHYMFPIIDVRGNIEHDLESGRGLDIETTVFGDFNQENCEIVVGLNIETKENQSHECYEIEIHCLGFFNVKFDEGEDDFETEEAKELAIVNAAQILYGLARDTTHTVTSKGPWGAIVLPTAYFSPKDIHKRP